MARFRYAYVASPLGTLTSVESERGVVAIDFARLSLRGLRQRLAALGDDVEFEERARLDSARELGEYAAGKRKRFTLAVDWSLVKTAFGRAVLDAMCAVPWGQVASYADLARAIGKPGATRAVGTACGKNPLPIVVPCHRVIAADGTIGGFSGGLPAKRALHRIEGIVTRDRR